MERIIISPSLGHLAANPRKDVGRALTHCAAHAQSPPIMASAKPSALLDTRVIYCGDNLEQLKKLQARIRELERQFAQKRRKIVRIRAVLNQDES